MKGIIKIFHFLGGLYFALFLIGLAACSVLVGTFLESRYDSHLLAEKWIYNSLFFSVLLSCFFINILFSALRRWPFKLRHVPFLITHLGLLLIIAGCIMKQVFGIQGNLLITEGSASDQLSIPHSLALLMQKKGEKETVFFPLRLNQKTSNEHVPWPNFKFQVRGFFPHAAEKKETWIKGSHVYVVGLPIIPVHKYEPGQDIAFKRLPISGTDFYVAALETKDLQEVLQKVYLKNLQINVAHKKGTVDLSLADLVQSHSNLYEGTANFLLNLSYSSKEGFLEPSLKMEWKRGNVTEINKVFLQGSKALYTYKDSEKGFPLFKMDLKRDKPIILFVKEEQGFEHLFAFDTFGRVYGESFDGSKLKSMWVYDEGFGGYSVQALLPFPSFGRKTKEKVDLNHLKNSLKESLKANSVLAPPFQMLKEACETIQEDVSEVFVNFLSHWSESQSVLLPAGETFSSEKVLHQLKWDKSALRSCQWMSLLFEKLEHLEGSDLLNELEKNQWPFITNLIEREKEGLDLWTALAQQMYEFGHHLPETPVNRHFDLARLLSAYFKAYGIDYPILQTHGNEGKEDFNKYEESYHPLQIETPLTYQHTILKPLSKLEENTPCVVIDFFDGDKKEKKSLVYDSRGEGFSHPLLDGQYRVRLGEKKEKILYRLRLQEARQINYGDSSQPYSFECDLTIQEKESQERLEKTLSMNHVYETWDGYRFYLSGMTTLTSGLKRVQIVVNYDPAKYFFTYPGGILTSLGIILLLWMRPYSSKIK